MENFLICMVKNGPGQSRLRALKCTISREWTDIINWFLLVCIYCTLIHTEPPMTPPLSLNPTEPHRPSNDLHWASLSPNEPYWPLLSPSETHWCPLNPNDPHLAPVSRTDPQGPKVSPTQSQWLSTGPQ